MILAMDIGNTDTKIGLFIESDDSPVRTWRIETHEHAGRDKIASDIYSLLISGGFNPEEIRAAAISCVVPPVLGKIKHVCDKCFKVKPLIAGIGIKTGLKTDYEHPEKIGGDRIANAVAAKELYGYPAIVIDFGTATTFDVISREGAYLGGVIAPGIGISSEALFNCARKLARVDLSWPDNIIGKNTRDGTRSGILFGFLGQSEFIIGKIIEQLESECRGFEPVIIATGGLAGLMVERSMYIKIHDPDLTLKGLKVLVDRNEKT